MGKITIGSYERVRSRFAADTAAPPAPLVLADEILALNPLGYWKLNETSGTTATDSSGNARHGTYSGTVTLNNIAGSSGGSYPNFQGGNVSIPDNAAFSLVTTPGLTLFALIKPDGVGTYKMLITKGAANNYEWQLTIGTPATGVLSLGSFTAVAGGNVKQLHTNSNVIVASTWQAVAFTMSTNTTSAVGNPYRNNNTPITPTAVTSSGTSDNGTAPVMLAYRADSPGATYQYAGAIGHVAIFAGVLNSTQIGRMMTAADDEGWY